MRIAALIAWIATAGFGLTMLSIWWQLGGSRSTFRRRLTSRRMVVHIVPAVVGLLVWITYIAAGPDALGWLALGLLAPVGGLGFWNFYLWQKRRLGTLRATPHSWDLPLAVAGNKQIPAEQHFPVVAVFLHGVLAVTTIALVLLANLGVGSGDGTERAQPRRVDHTAPLVGVRLPSAQRLSGTKGVTASVVCDERCSVGLSARFSLPDGSQRRLYTRAIAKPGQLLRLRTPLTTTARREIRRRGVVAMRATLRACDVSGNCTPLMRRAVRMRR